jgi:hypothetical protein
MMVISNWVIINDGAVSRNNILVNKYENLTPELLYKDLNCNYPKFFKMDKLCKWAIVAAECLFSGGNTIYNDINNIKVAVALSTNHGCLDIDKKYYDTIKVPSPALFVYTLPNIMLGELCIRHGFKGEQVCIVSGQFDATELYFAVQGFLKNSGMDACLCGWVDVTGEQYDVFLLWVTNGGKGLNFTPAILEQLYGQNKA